ncbi:helix-turn-helix domain-containing protein [Eubacteriaceae bacterium ES3]|nr:helix-turn-helix domain-containing protein [Eubacteriaceae bacterium ES3]
MTIPRMRTVPESAALLKEMDENTSLTQCAIRRLVVEGKIKSVKAGRKHLINFDDLISYLANPTPVEVPEEAVHESVNTIGVDRMDEYKKRIGLTK